ncbi:MAG: PKD domain-containing protein [Cyclobacteriaceae bacterium]
MKKAFNNLTKLIAGMVLVMGAISCGEDPIPAPSAAFTFAIDESNDLTVQFTNSSVDGETYAWDFGDGVGTSTEESPVYTYGSTGTYTVVLTVTNESGTSTDEQDVAVTGPPVNLILNGTFDDDSEWTVIQMNANNNGVISFDNEVANFNEIEDIAEGSWDAAWAHVGMYQTVEVEAGTYKIDMEVKTDGINETWVETWVGAVEPAPEDDYNGDDGAERAAMINAWDCAGTVTYEGLLSQASCLDGNITFAEAGTYYVLIRGGGFNFGPEGVTIDNVTMFRQ